MIMKNFFLIDNEGLKIKGVGLHIFDNNVIENIFSISKAQDLYMSNRYE